jgi:hypothetical protein
MRRLAVLFCTIALGGCGAVPNRSPVTGLLYTNVQGADNVTENAVSGKVSKSCVGGISVPISAAWGSASAAGAVGVYSAKISVVDSDMLGILGLYAQHCVVVHEAGGADAVPSTAPATPRPVPGSINPPRPVLPTNPVVPPGAQPAQPAQPGAPPAPQPGDTAI